MGVNEYNPHRQSFPMGMNATTGVKRDFISAIDKQRSKVMGQNKRYLLQQKRKQASF